MSFWKLYAYAMQRLSIIIKNITIYEQIFERLSAFNVAKKKENLSS